jgi:hypothetical protein
VLAAPDALLQQKMRRQHEGDRWHGKDQGGDPASGGELLVDGVEDVKATEAALNSTTSAHGYQVGRLARLAATTVRVATTMKPSSTPGQIRANPGRTPLARASEWRAS